MELRYLCSLGGVSIAENGQAWWRFIHKRIAIVAVFGCIVLLGVSFRRDALVLHMLFDIVFIFALVLFASYRHVKITGLPHWVSACSYDIYLVHNKALMILRPCSIVLPLWQFAGLSFLFTIVFYNLRKVLKL